MKFPCDCRKQSSDVCEMHAEAAETQTREYSGVILLRKGMHQEE